MAIRNMISGQRKEDPGSTISLLDENIISEEVD